MNIDEYMLNENTIRKNKILKEMNDYIKDKSSDFKNSKEYKDKYNHYLALLAAIDNSSDEFIEDEIDIVKHKHNPYLKLKYFISEYTSYYYRIVKSEYFKIIKKLDIKLDVDNLEETMKKLEKKINSLKNEKKINYILNVNEIINNALK